MGRVGGVARGETPRAISERGVERKRDTGTGTRELRPGGGIDGQSALREPKSPAPDPGNGHAHRPQSGLCSSPSYSETEGRDRPRGAEDRGPRIKRSEKRGRKGDGLAGCWVGA